MSDLERFAADVDEVLELERARRRRRTALDASLNRCLAEAVALGLETRDEGVEAHGGKALELLREFQEVRDGR